MSKKNLFIVLGISTAFLVGGVGIPSLKKFRKKCQYPPVQIVNTKTDETTK
ncbi:hypothetical protein ACIQ1D_02530 [Lysinibacillus xylanilyticus]|uniref:hypothetical protein n=1 Tax=Lysinibacillus xylanilyticus TaxID=582475 RepID=UPI00381AFACA